MNIIRIKRKRVKNYLPAHSKLCYINIYIHTTHGAESDIVHIHYKS